MKKLLLSVALVAASFGASAASDSKSFDVRVKLLAVCKLSTISLVDFGDYTSMQTTGITSTGGAFTATCTNSLPYSLKFISDAGANTDGGTFPTTQLAYTLGLSASTGLIGNGAAQSYNVTGAMAGNQIGTCASPVASACDETRTGAHTVFVVY